MGVLVSPSPQSGCQSPGQPRAKLKLPGSVTRVGSGVWLARALGGRAVELVGRPAHHPVHLGLVLPERAADRHAPARARRHRRRRFAPQVLVDAALHDPVDDLMRGAVLGGFVIALVEQFGSFYLSSAYRDVFVFVLLILILLVRPSGLLGSPLQEKV